MKRKSTLFILLTIFMMTTFTVVTAGRGVSPAVARALPGEKQSQSADLDNSSSAKDPITVVSTCDLPPGGQGAGIVFDYEVLGKKVILGASSSDETTSSDDDETVLAESASSDAVNQADANKVLLAEQTLYTSNSDFAMGIDSLLVPHIGNEVDIDDLREIKNEVSLLYQQGNYITSWSDCVELRSNGRLVIHVTEGFIYDVNVGRIGERAAVYVPAEKTTLGREVLEFIAPILLDENGLPRRPINLAQLDAGLQSISGDSRFASEQTFSRLRVPTPSFLDNSNGAFHADTVEPGASVLEVGIKVLADEVGAAEDPPFASRLIASTAALEDRRIDAFRNHFGQEFKRTFVDERLIRFALHSLELQEPSIKAAVVYIASDGDQVSIRVETADARPIEIQNIVRFDREEVSDREFTFDNGQFEPVEEAEAEAESESINPIVSLFRALFPGSAVGRDELVAEVERFWRAVQNPDSDSYQRHADQLYDLLIRSIENEFDARGIEVNTLLVAMDADLGLLPLASLYDSETEQYLAEKYRLSVLPSFRALDIRPSNLEGTEILAMGTSEFRQADRYAPLAAVPIELRLIKEIWGEAEVFRNADFTLENLRQQRREHPYSIVHLASHANFRAGRPGDSSIQLWDTTLPLNDLQVSTLNFNRPPLELLVLSACQTALGDEEAVLGFAGSFLNAEVKSVLASLWAVNDVTSLLYMIEFYRNLSQGLTKAEAVQNSQLALLDEQRTTQNLKELRLVVDLLLNDAQGRDDLTEAEMSRLRRMSDDIASDVEIADIAEEFTHPFYWSAYTLVGNPW
jgi:CHAT domain-containing protein